MKDDLKKDYLKNLSLALAAAVTRARVSIRRHLTNLDISGSTDIKKYPELMYSGDLPNKIPQAYDYHLDMLGQMFDVERRFNEDDESYRQRIIFKIKISTTKNGIKNTVKFIFETSPFFNKSDDSNIVYDVVILENYKNFFDGVNTSFDQPMRDYSLSHGITVYIKPVDARNSQGELLKLVRNANYKRILDISGNSGFREMLETVAAAGIIVDRVIFEQVGSGGNKGEIYAYKA